MDEASQLAEILRQSLVQERDVTFVANVRKRALSRAKRRLWTGRAVACAGILSVVLLLEELRRAAVVSLAPALAAAAGNGVLVQAPVGLALAAVALFFLGLAASRF